SKIIGMDGVYVFQGVSVGEHTLTVQATGFKNRSQTITVEEGQSSNNRIDISLEPDGFPSPAPTPTPSGMGDIAGIVSNSTTGEGINNATVILDGTGDTTTTTTIFGFSGVYIFQGVPVGEHTITAEALDFKSNTQNIVVEEGQSINNRFDISLEPQDIPSPTPTPTPMGTGDIAGIVSNSITGEPINNATVTIADTGKTTISKTIRGQDGVYIFQDVSVGNHTLAAEATGFKSSVQTIAVEEGQSVNNRFDISLEPQSLPTPTPTPTGSGDIAGIVRNAETGEGINNATVTIEDSGNTTRTTTALGQKGVYVFQDISVGEHTLTARAVGFRSSTQIITVEEGQSVNNRFDISLEPDGFPSPSPTPTPSGLGDISGIVRNAKTGEGINNATVLIEDTGDMTKTTTALGQKGVYLFLDIPVGLHVFVAQAAGFMEARSINIVREGQNRVDFSLEPETSPTPAPECMAESMETDPEKTLEIMVGDSSDITVMLEGLSEGDCNASNVEVRAEVSGGDARIDLSSTSEITDENGAATFTIRALMDGNAKIKFEADGYTFKKNDFKPKTLKEKIQVKIGKASQ
ncbi:MAG: carboxypeptidase-like regulatory domain-containing protein, partial [Candidatus Brocadiaceae bacterium]|nr:carboxypeptidase-like regulatory domain-containing protein [Candidatus Brocadiaceae bacterium]